MRSESGSSAPSSSERDDYVPDVQRAMLNILEDSDEEKKRLELSQTATLNILEDFAEEKARFGDVQRATQNILEDFDEEKSRFAEMQTATLNILEDLTAEKTRFGEVQTATQNILEDFVEEKSRFAQMQTATLNILEDSEAERHQLQLSQRAFLNILEDIDIEKQKVADAYQQIEAVNKELEAFTYVASHDLRAPLRVIDNASQWIEEDLQECLNDETRENMKLLRGRVRRMEKLLDDLLQFSRVGRKADERFLEVVPGNVLMQDIIEMLSPPQGFTVTASPAFADIQICRMPLQQLLMNLVSNAIKHHDKKAGHIEVTVEDGGAYFNFSVKDDGPGIPAQFHETVFQMFQTLKPRDQVEGSGMGLAMVRKYLDVYGGTVTLESSEGKGSTFRVSWPKCQRVVQTGTGVSAPHIPGLHGAPQAIPGDGGKP